MNILDKIIRIYGFEHPLTIKIAELIENNKKIEEKHLLPECSKYICFNLWEGVSGKYYLIS